MRPKLGNAVAVDELYVQVCREECWGLISCRQGCICS